MKKALLLCMVLILCMPTITVHASKDNKTQVEESIKNLKFTYYEDFIERFDLSSVKLPGNKSICNPVIEHMKYANGVLLASVNAAADDGSDEFYTVIFRSEDGIKWSSVLAFENRSASEINYVNNKFIIKKFYDKDTYTYHLMESADGLNWKEYTIKYQPSLAASPGYFKLPIREILYGNGVYLSYVYDVAGPYFQWHNKELIPINQVIYRSTDGINWTEDFKEQYDSKVQNNEGDSVENVLGYFNYGEDYQFHDMVFQKGVFVGVTPKFVAYSDNGVKWNYSDKLKRNNEFWDDYLWSIDYGKGTSVIAGATNIWRSVDGKKWDLTFKDNNACFTKVEYGNGIFVAINNNNTNIIVSQDGMSWKKVNLLGKYARLNDLYYGKGRFYICTSGGWLVSDFLGEYEESVETEANTNSSRAVGIGVPLNDQSGYPHIDQNNKTQVSSITALEAVPEASGGEGNGLNKFSMNNLFSKIGSLKDGIIKEYGEPDDKGVNDKYYPFLKYSKPQLIFYYHDKEIPKPSIYSDDEDKSIIAILIKDSGISINGVHTGMKLQDAISILGGTPYWVNDYSCVHYSFRKNTETMPTQAMYIKYASEDPDKVITGIILYRVNLLTTGFLESKDLR